MKKRAALVLGIVVLALVTAGIVLSREETLRWVAHKAEERSAGKLVLADPAGSLLSHVHLARLYWKGERLEIDANDVNLAWAPWWLLAGKLAFRRAEASNLAIVRHPREGEQAGTLPRRLHAPLRMRFENVRTGSFTYSPRPGSVHRFGSTAFDLDLGAREWKLDLDHLESRFGRLTGKGSLGTQSPFTTRAVFDLVREGADPQHPLRTHANFSGVLTQLDIDARTTAARTNMHALLQVAPLQPQPLRRIDATFDVLDPSEIGRRMPAAALAGTIKADTGNDGVLRGRIDLANREAGTLDAKRLPVAALRADIATETERWQANDVVLSLGDGGQLRGKAWVGDDDAGVDLTGDSIDLHAVHTALQPTRLNATLHSDGPFRAQHVRLDARERRLQVALDAIIGTERIDIKQARATASGGTATVNGTVARNDDHAFAVSGTLTRFDPSAWGKKLPKANLNASVKAEGAFAPVLQVRGSGKLNPSTLFGQAASGHGTFTSRGKDSPAIGVELAAALGATRLDVRGTIKDPQHLQALDLALEIRGRNLADLWPITGLPYPDTGPYSVKGELAFRERVWSFRRFRGQVGNSDLEGDFVVDLTRDRPRMTADLTSQRLDITDLGGFVGAGGPTPRRRNRVFSNRAFDPQHLNKADVDIRFHGRSIRNERLPLRAMNARFVLERGQVKVQPLQFRAAGGEIDARIDADAHSVPIHATADVQVRGLRINQLAPGVKAMMSSAGVLEGRTRLEMRGNSIADLVASANGDLVLAMNGGSMSDVVLRLANLDVANTIAAIAKGNRSVPVRCVIADFTARDGVLAPRTLVLDSEHTVVRGEGHIDLRDERLALRLRADPKDGSLLALRGPIRIEGNLAKPAVHPDLKSGLVRAGAAAALATLAPPLAILPFLEHGKKQKVDCQPLIVEAARFLRTGEKSDANGVAVVEHVEPRTAAIHKP